MPLRPASRGSLAAAGGAWLVRFSRARRGGTEARRSRHRPRRLLCSDSCPSARSVTDHAAQTRRAAPFEQSPRAVLPRSLSPTCPAHAADAPAPCRAATPLPAARPPRADTATHSHQSVSLSVSQSALGRSDPTVAHLLQGLVVRKQAPLRRCSRGRRGPSHRPGPTHCVARGRAVGVNVPLRRDVCRRRVLLALVTSGSVRLAAGHNNRVNRDKRRQIATNHLAFGATTAAARGRLRGLRVSAALASATATLETWQQLLR